jgi:hypothetical protein
MKPWISPGRLGRLQMLQVGGKSSTGPLAV